MPEYVETVGTGKSYFCGAFTGFVVLGKAIVEDKTRGTDQMKFCFIESETQIQMNNTVLWQSRAPEKK